MPAGRKIIFLAGILAALVAAGVWLNRAGRPGAESWKPLAVVKPEAIRRVEFDRTDGNLVLERAEDQWRLASPVEDRAEPAAVDRLLDTVTNFELGSVVSENPERYRTFELDEGAARRIRVFVTDSEEPALDGFIGKAAPVMMTSYFRFADRAPVYIAKDLPRYLVDAPPDDFRLRTLLPVDWDAVDAISVRAPGRDFELAFSSPAWTAAGGTTVDSGWVDLLKIRLKSLRAARLESAPAGKTGLDKPVYVVEVSAANRTETGRLGGKTTGNGGTEFRYARTDGREAILLINAALVDRLDAHLKAFKRD